MPHIRPCGPSGLLTSGLKWILGPWPDEKELIGDTMRHKVFDPELLTRTSWVDARTGYRQVSKGKANGNARSLWVRWHIQQHLFNLGCFIQKHCGKVLFIGLLLLSCCCVGLKLASVETNVEKLWIEADGRLQRELQYTKKVLGEGSGTTNEIIIQTPKTKKDVLSVDSLLLHFQAVHAATKVQVDLFGKTWKFRDLCYAANFPSFENYLFDTILGNLLPCVIVTPLDCFWEGSKLLGPEHGIYVPGIPASDIKWTNLNPKQLVEYFEGYGSAFPVEPLKEILERAGIGNAYQDKPCLNPEDPECPDTAPNKASKQPPEVGVELTGGCHGFAARYMQWEEELILGGIHKNKSGNISGLKAYQTILQLMGEKEIYEYYHDHITVQRLDWTQEKAKLLLETWQRKFTQEVDRIARGHNDTSRDNVYAFSSTSLLDLLEKFSEMSIARVALGYALMLMYAVVSLLRLTDGVRSQGGIGIAGVILVALSVAAGLGLCCVIGIRLNASTTQIIPFLALGLGVDDMFLLAHSFAEITAKPEIPYPEQTGECLKRTGVSVLLTSVINMVAFFMGAVIPIPALRAFCLQAAILVIVNLLSNLLVFPAIVSLDLMRREQKRIDIFCCFKGSISPELELDIVDSRPAPTPVIELQPRQGTPPPDYREVGPPTTLRNNFMEQSPPSYASAMRHHHTVTQTEPDGTRPMTMLATGATEAGAGVCNNQVTPASPAPSTTSSRQCLAPEDTMTCKERCAQYRCAGRPLTRFATKVYGPFLERTPVKIFVIVAFFILLVLGIVGTIRVKDGLDLTDVVPRQTREYKFLDAQSKYFGFYNFYAVTQEDFDYANNQPLLYEYHQAFQRVHNIIKKEDGTLPDFWLQLFRSWLLNIQSTFDKELANGWFTAHGWHQNASDTGILGYKLLAQTGDIDKPVDRERILTGRLVDKDGVIYPQAFYNYLSAWTWNDAMAYTASQADFHPEPREWIHTVETTDLKIDKSQPLVYSQLPFYLHEMADTEHITDTIEEIRGICETFVKKGIPNYPRGIPFTFWEQYINLRFYLMLALLCVLGGNFLVLSVMLVNLWAAAIVVVVLAMMVVELFGLMGLIGIKLSAVPAVILVVSVGIGVEFTVHVCLGFVTSIGSKNKRMRMTLQHMFAPVIHGAASTLLGVILLAWAEFDFIVKYFFVVLLLLVLLGLLNGLVLLPVLLSMIGPPAEVIPLDNGDELPPPTPEPSPPPPRRSRGRRVYPRIPSDISLSTITEEPTQYSSHEIIVHPEVIVETTLPGGVTNIINTANGSSSSSSRNTTPPGSSHSTPPPVRHITRVTATAKVKVEVHTPLPGVVEQHNNYKSKKRKLKEVDSGSNSDSDSGARSS